MNELEGQPIRNATSDANSGIIDPPAKRYSTREVNEVSTIDNTQVNQAVATIGVNLGNALQKRLQEQNAYTAQRLANTAAARQGEQTAINKVDQLNKRTGWQKGVFGESVQYREAQQRAATNAVQAEYLKQATSIDQFSGESADAYRERLNEGLTKVLDLYKGDKETQDIVANNWYTLSSKLAAKQAESHYGYNQLQQRASYDQQVAQTFDGWTVDAALAASPEEQFELVKQSESFFKGVTKPKGMDSVAWRGSINTNLQNALRKGNIGAYNAAKSAGWLESLSASERTAMDQALSVYDTDFTQKAQLVFEEGELAAMDAPYLATAKAIYQQVRSNIDQLARRSSGTDRANLALARTQQQAAKGALSAQEAMDAANKEARKIAMTAAEKALELQAEEERINNLKWSTRIEDPIERASFVNQIPHNQSDLEDAMDQSIVDDATRLSGAEDTLDMTTTTQTIFSDPINGPKIASVVAKRYNKQETHSPLVQRAVVGFIDGFTGMADDNGLLNERGMTALQSIAQFEKNPAKFRKTVTEERYAELQIIKQGLLGGKTVEQVDKLVTKYKDNKGKRDILPVQWGLGKNETKQQKIQSLVTKFSNQPAPQGDTLIDYMETFDTGLTIYGSDWRSAEKYLKDYVESNNTQYKGIRIEGGEQLNKVTDYSFETLMDGAQKHAMGADSVSMLTPYLVALTGEQRDTAGNVLTNMSQIQGFSIKADTVNGGFYIDSTNAQQPVYVSEEQMKRISSTLSERDKLRKAREKRERGTILQEWGKQEMVAPLSNLN